VLLGAAAASINLEAFAIPEAGETVNNTKPPQRRHWRVSLACHERVVGCGHAGNLELAQRGVLDRNPHPVVFAMVQSSIVTANAEITRMPLTPVPAPLMSSPFKMTLSLESALMMTPVVPADRMPADHTVADDA